MTVNGRSFNSNWKVSLFCAVCLGSFVHLGFWQLDREEEKRVLLEEREARLQQPPIKASIVQSEGPDLAGLPILLSGNFLQEFTLLLDNVVLEGNVGFEVHQLFRDYSGRHFLVNRGFVPMGRTRDDPVDIPAVSGKQVQIVGSVYQKGGAPLSLQHEQNLENDFPAIVQHIDIVQLRNTVDRDVYPHVIRLKEGQHGALPRYWPDTVIPPEKHLGYAIQWFAMATAVVILWLVFSFPKKEQ